MQQEFLKSKIFVLLPDSLLENEDTLLLKTRKIGFLARIMTIFRIPKVFFYDDSGSTEDKQILANILNYLNAPPYLRKYIPRTSNLRNTAILTPIHSPNHIGVRYNNIDYVAGMVVESTETGIYVDIGTGSPQKISTSLRFDNRESVIVQSKNQDVSLVTQFPPSLYWHTNYEIISRTIEDYILEHPDSYVIGASKSGDAVTYSILKEIQQHTHPTYLLACGPLQGSFRAYIKNPDLIDKWINFIPNQGTKTVKIEEALHSALSLMNLCSLNLK